MFPARVPAVVRWLTPAALWRMPSEERSLYLSFDDGPHPEVTPWVLDRLAEFNAKATFFVIGRNAHDHPAIMERIRDDGHSIGNHTWDHVNGWRTSCRTYINDVDRAQPLVGTRLFRPPYGRITRKQANQLRKRFDLVMWDILSSDFDVRVGPEQCALNVLDHARPGSIVIFHDSAKAEERLRVALPRVLQHFTQQEYSFLALPEHGLTAAPK
ncbi:MAG: polysaccharide deacetylase family protein [Flavobacteriales bacterium]|nr:polysaccharide deacetylase family protein [Flavobacteriales bacterium]